MGRIKKKGTSGQAKNFITRTQAVRKLQISLPDFRRLCIFKGIYPREPRNKKKASKSSTQSTTFYYTKDIQYLLHEPLLNKFRDHKALSKKIARSLGRGEVTDAARLEKNGSKKVSLDHIIKERYPTFVDALRDLDDALSLLFLFANLPSTTTVPAKTIALCQRLCLEFQHYLIVSHSLRKSFLSIKGIYYQATIQGQDIMWLVPYRFVQRVTGDVDFRIMGTFVEFYTTLLGFVNFRLYTSIGLIYPPKFDVKSDERGGELGAITLEGKATQDMKLLSVSDTNAQNDSINHPTDESVQERVDAITADLEQQDEPEMDNPAPDGADATNEAIDTFTTTDATADTLPQPQISHSEASNLFSQFTFFLSREAPRQPIEFLLKAFGSKRVGWDTVLGDGAYTHNENDTSITHQIVDRPQIPVSNMPEPSVDTNGKTPAVQQDVLPGHRVPGRTYVQPQWVWDCVNQGKLLRPDLYAPGALLPPHLSPWVKPNSKRYDPTESLEAQEREGEADEFAEEEAEAAAIADVEDNEMGEDVPEELNNEAEDAAKADIHDNNDEEFGDHGMHVGGTDSSEESTDEDGFDGFEDNDLMDEGTENEPTEQDLYQAELEAEAAGLTFAEAQAVSTGAASSDKSKALKGILKTSKGGDEARKRASKKKQEEEEELQRRMGMMSRKKRKLMEKMMYGKRQEEAEAEALRKKRRKIEQAQKQAKT